MTERLIECIALSMNGYKSDVAVPFGWFRASLSLMETARRRRANRGHLGVLALEKGVKGNTVWRQRNPEEEGGAEGGRRKEEGRMRRRKEEERGAESKGRGAEEGRVPPPPADLQPLPSASPSPEKERR